MGLAENIRRVRKKKGWSQKELGEMIGSHLSHINRIETGKYKPSLDVLKKIADALEVTLDYLVSDKEEDLQEVKIEDKNMAERIKLLNTLEPEDRKAVIRVIDAMLTKKKIFRIVSGESQTENLAQQISQ